MAITAVTARGSYGSSANIGTGGTFATSAFTPSAECLLLAWVATQGAPGVASNGIASISGHGTWAQLPSDIGDLPYLGSNDQRGEWWYTFSGASPSSTAVTVTNTTQTKIRAALSVFEVVGDNIDSASDIYDIVIQIESNEDTSGSTSGSVTLASFTGSGYAAVCGVVCGRYNEGYTWDSPMVEIDDLATNTEQMRASTAYYIGEDTSPGWSWSATNRTWRAIALELNDPAGGTPATATPGVIARSFSVPAPTVTGTANATPSAIARSFALPTPPASGTANASPGVIALSASLPAPSATGGATASPAAIAVPATLPTPTGTGTATTSPGVIALAFTVPQPVATGGSASDGTANPAVIALAFATPAPSVTGTAAASPGVVALAFTLPAPTATGDGNALPGAIAVVFATPAPTGTGSATASPATIALAFVVPTPESALIDGIDDRPWAFYVYRRLGSDVLFMCPSGKQVSRQAWKPAEGWADVSERFRANVTIDRDTIDALTDNAWATHAGSDDATLQTAIHSALTAAGVKRYDGTALT